MTDDTLIIGDVHGHYDRLCALLLQEGLIDEDDKRLLPNTRIIQLGDLGHNGFDTDYPDGDKLCYEAVRKWDMEFILGNHDAALIHRRHIFSGYSKMALADDMLRIAIPTVRFAPLAASAHDYLITHAGVHSYYGGKLSRDPKVAATEINERNPVENYSDIRDAIPYERGGSSLRGGILWRHDPSSLSHRWPQIFGHSVQFDKIRIIGNKKDKDRPHYNIDLGLRDNGRLGGIWLPSQRLVEVKLGSEKLKNIKLPDDLKQELSLERLLTELS